MCPLFWMCHCSQDLEPRKYMYEKIHLFIYLSLHVCTHINISIYLCLYLWNFRSSHWYLHSKPMQFLSFHICNYFLQQWKPYLPIILNIVTYLINLAVCNQYPIAAKHTLHPSHPSWATTLLFRLQRLSSSTLPTDAYLLCSLTVDLVLNCSGKKGKERE